MLLSSGTFQPHCTLWGSTVNLNVVMQGTAVFKMVFQALVSPPRSVTAPQFPLGGDSEAQANQNMMSPELGGSVQAGHVTREKSPGHS
jgi:hypothetical protein